jgi:hypothetical protein
MMTSLSFGFGNIARPDGRPEGGGQGVGKFFHHTLPFLSFEKRALTGILPTGSDDEGTARRRSGGATGSSDFLYAAVIVAGHSNGSDENSDNHPR